MQYQPFIKRTVLVAEDDAHIGVILKIMPLVMRISPGCKVVPYIFEESNT